jgi:hypothetical protein
MGLWVKENGKSEGHPVMGWIGVVTLLSAKAGRLPCGLSSREHLRKRYRRKSR